MTLLNHITRAFFGETLDVSQSEWRAGSRSWAAKADQWKRSVWFFLQQVGTG